MQAYAIYIPYIVVLCVLNRQRCEEKKMKWFPLSTFFPPTSLNKYNGTHIFSLSNKMYKDGEEGKEDRCREKRAYHGLPRHDMHAPPFRGYDEHSLIKRL